MGTCAAPSCNDDVRNGRESGVDCGESCLPKLCPRDDVCRHNEDCQSLVCDQERCSEATCEDAVKNGAETDKDCGGSKCKKCPDNKACAKASDCESGICREADELCVQASCVDGQLSPGELAVDCGGPCGPCGAASKCVKDSDCESMNCVNSKCAEASCDDGRKNQDETDLDCGGEHCPACDTGGTCETNDGCLSLVCVQHECAAASCEDFTKNGDESGVDCGGSCGGCQAGIACVKNEDCASSVCSDGLCQAPRCDDGVKNGSESDRDCGTGCSPCAISRSCISDDDCASKACAQVCVSSLRVDLLCTDRSSAATALQPYFRVVNAGKKPFPLSSLTLRYYYSKDAAGAEEYRCFNVINGGCGQLLPGVFGSVTSKTSTADRYLELHYSPSASTLAVNQVSEIQGEFHVPNHLPFTQTNDYSFSNSTSFQSSSNVTLYANGVLVWGTEP